MIHGAKVDLKTQVSNCSDSGWMDSDQFTEWFEKVFLPATSHFEGGKLLVFDGHNSHLSTKVVDIAVQNNTELLCLPGHTSSILQPLDVGVFTNFKKVLMRDELTFWLKQNECRILNMDTSKNVGTHQVCWYKNGKDKIYLDSFGVQPPLELIKYLSSPIVYSTYQIQQYNDSNCSEWCLYILNKLNKSGDFFDIILNIVNDVQ